MPFLGNTTTSFNVDGNNINNGAITSEKIAAGAVVNADVNDTASIAGTKISADFGAQDLIVDTNLLFVDASEDRIGVGTSSPSQLLQVNGTAYVADDHIRLLLDSGNGRLQIRSASDVTNIDLYGSNGQAYFAGNVGVGTANPGALLEVQGADTAIGSNGTILVKADSAGADDGGQITLGSGNGRHVAVAGRSEGSSGTAGYLQLGVRGSSGDIVERLRIDSSGRVGIGTSSPGSYNADAADLVIGSSGSNGLTIVSGTTNNGNIFFADGTSGNDQLRGFIQYNHQLNFFNIGTNATSAIRIDSSQRVGIGTTSPGSFFSGANQLVVGDGAGGRGITIYTSSTEHGYLTFNDTGNTTTQGWIGYDHATNALELASNGSERARIDSSGRLLVGTSSDGTGRRLQVEGTDFAGSCISTRRESNNNGGSAIELYKSRGSGFEIVSNDDQLGYLRFYGSQGSADAEAARIRVDVDGTPSATSMPGRMLFFTTPSGSTTPAERFRLGPAGQFGIAGANYGSSGQVLTSQGSGSAPQWATPSSASWTSTSVNAGPTGGVVAFTSIPSDIDFFIMSWNNVNSTANSTYAVEMGHGGSYQTSGYNVNSGYLPNGTTNPGVSRYTTSFFWRGSAGGGNNFGRIWFSRHNTGNVWHAFGNAHDDGSDIIYIMSGSCSLGGTLDRIRLILGSGGFDSQGSVTLQYLRT